MRLAYVLSNILCSTVIRTFPCSWIRARIPLAVLRTFPYLAQCIRLNVCKGFVSIDIQQRHTGRVQYINAHTAIAIHDVFVRPTSPHATINRDNQRQRQPTTRTTNNSTCTHHQYIPYHWIRACIPLAVIHTFPYLAHSSDEQFPISLDTRMHSVGSDTHFPISGTVRHHHHHPDRQSHVC